MPLLILGNLLISLPIYWIVGLQADFFKYLIFCIISLVHGTCALTLGLVIGSASPSAELGQAFGPLILILYMLFSGNSNSNDRTFSKYRFYLGWNSMDSSMYVILTCSTLI